MKILKEALINTAAQDVERRAARGRREASQLLTSQAVQQPFRAPCIPSEVAQRAQDAPRACKANSDLLAITRLARPNKLNNCAVFLARPL